jgi:hypothetical protein
MTKEESIVKILANEWWPFDRVDPEIMKEAERRTGQQTLDKLGEALL